MPRYLRPLDGLLARYAATPRPFHFAPERHEFGAWHREFKAALEQHLGPTPEPVPLNPEVTSSEDLGSYTREHVIFDSEAYAAVPAWVLTPKSATPDHPAPGMLCLHGHGFDGKDNLVGAKRGQPDFRPDHRYNLLAVRLVNEGYVCICPDWRGFGERMDTDQWVRRPSRDGCNVMYLAGGYLGFHALRLDIFDGQRTIDYLHTRPEVDPTRLGAAGLSFGGTMTTYLSALDERITCAAILCYLSTLQDGLERGNFCGSQYMPQLGALADIPDVAGLIAPRPMLAEIGERDLCFLIDDAQAACDHVQTIYDAAGVPDHFAVDRFDGEHEFHGVDSVAWLNRWLRPGAV